MITPVLPVYNRSKFAVVKGEGMYLYTDDGRKMLDFASGIGVNSLGHCHPKAVEALKKQADTLWHTSNLYTIPGQAELANKLIANSFADTVFFCNSGTEAIEAGIKMVRKHFDHIGKPEKYRIITLEGAFHGRTMAAISAGGKIKYVSGFEPLLDGFDQVSWASPHEIRSKITPFTAAILVEPILGEGGIKEVPAQCLKGLRDLCDEFGLLLFFDEVQCGMGRTGKLFAHQDVDVKPDIVASAKGIGTGFPLGALLATEKAAECMVAGTHGTTYGGNPLAMAVGNAVVDVILENGFLENVVKQGAKLKDGLEKISKRHHNIIKGVRGRGLMLGLEMGVTNTDFVNKLREHNLLTVSASDNILRIMPPLIIGDEHIKEGLSIIEKVCGEIG